MKISPENRERSHTDLEFSDYITYEASIYEVRAGIESWLREAMIKPFAYEGSIENGKFVAFGQSMVEMAEHGIQERVGQVGEARARADLAGVCKIEDWLKQEAQNGDVVVLLSPPGTEEEGFGAHGQRRLSFTQIGVVKIEAGRKEIRMVSLPEAEIGIPQHIWRVHSVWNDAITTWMRESEKTDRGLVSAPIFIPAKYIGDGLNEYVKKQGKSGWEEIEQELKQGLALKEDEKAEQRRRSLIDTITWQVTRYVEERDAARLNNIGMVARILMAREAAGKYLHWDSERLLNEYEEIEGAMWFKKKLKDKGWLGYIGEWIKNGAEAVQAYTIINRLRGQLAGEWDVQQMLMGSSCGGGGIDNLMWEGGNLGKFGSQGSYLDRLVSNALGIQKSNESNESTTTMECVTCPFCHETVDAIVTSTKIKCPKCKAEASTG